MGDCEPQSVYLVVEQDVAWAKEETLCLWTTQAAADDWLAALDRERPRLHGQRRAVVEYYLDVAQYPQPYKYVDDPTNPQPNDGMVSWASRTLHVDEPFGINEMGRVIR